MDDWKRAIWSDETKINRLENDGFGIEWINSQETRLEVKNYIDKSKLRGGNIRLWGCMNWNGVRYINKVGVKIEIDQYIKFLTQC